MEYNFVTIKATIIVII